MLRKYLPCIMQDAKEPFQLAAIGTTVFTKTSLSRSFRRTVEVPEDGFVAEYQLYWLYDIQHLYDLEHIWVTVSDDHIVALESSFHGYYMQTLSLADRKEGKPVLYCQPGKHAFLPQGRLFELLPDVDRCCNTEAGRDGLLVADLFADRYGTNDVRNAKVRQHITKTYAFHPSWQWTELSTQEVPMMEWEALMDFIALSITKELERLQA